MLDVLSNGAGAPIGYEVYRGSIRGTGRPNGESPELDGFGLLKALLDNRPFPVFVMDRTLTVRLVNAAVRDGNALEGVHIAENRPLKFEDEGDTAEFLRLIKTAAAAGGLRSSAALFYFSAGDGRVRVLALSGVEIGRQNGQPPVQVFIVSVRENLGALDIDPARLVVTFGLTRAEANVCAALARGQSLQDYASSERIKVSTARWHLQNVYERTGVGSQSELLAMIVSVLL